MGKHTLEIEYDYDFLLIGISSHEKDYRLAWAINKAFEIELSKQDSLEIKGKKQLTPSYFSFFFCENEIEFKDYAVMANLSESKAGHSSKHTLFQETGNIKKSKNENEYLIPEQKQMDYFFIVRGEFNETEAEAVLKKIKQIEIIQAAIRIDAKSLKTKQNLVF